MLTRINYLYYQMPSVILAHQWAVTHDGIWDQHNASVLCSLLVSVLHSSYILRVWSSAKFIFLKSESEELKKLFDVTLAIKTELGTNLQELFTHSLSVSDIIFWNVESTSQRPWQRSGCDMRSSKKKDINALTMVFKRKRSHLKCI